MDDILKKYENRLGMTRKELRAALEDALSTENYEERLLEIFGPENIEDIAKLCLALPQAGTKKFFSFEDFDFERFQEHRFEAVASRGMYGEDPVPITRVREGQRHFGFEFFNYVQSAVFDAVYTTDENVLVAAPTGSGKTEIAILGMLKALDAGRGKAVYIAPMKALATEITQKLERGLGRRACEFTGDTEVPSAEARRYEVFVATPEKFEVVTRRRGNIFESSLALIVLDEIHLLQDERGGVLESILCRVSRCTGPSGARIRVIGMSATPAECGGRRCVHKCKKFLQLRRHLQTGEPRDFGSGGLWLPKKVRKENRRADRRGDFRRLSGQD